MAGYGGQRVFRASGWIRVAVGLSTLLCAAGAAFMYVHGGSWFITGSLALMTLVGAGGLLECFISIVKALLAYSDAGAGAAAQSILIANIAVALGASAVGCFVALIAHSLKAVLNHRMSRA